MFLVQRILNKLHITKLQSGHHTRRMLPLYLVRCRIADLIRLIEVALLPSKTVNASSIASCFATQNVKKHCRTCWKCPSLVLKRTSNYFHYQSVAVFPILSWNSAPQTCRLSGAILSETCSLAHTKVRMSKTMYCWKWRFWILQGNVVTFKGEVGNCRVFVNIYAKFIQNFVHQKLSKSTEFWPNI